MITGIGTDLVEVARICKACEKESFLKRYFTEAELTLIYKDPIKAADNFAVKEAVAKALGTGFRTFFPIDIEVLRDEQGKPYVNLYGKAKEIAEEVGIIIIHVSITNTKKYANAFAICERLP